MLNRRTVFIDSALESKNILFGCWMQEDSGTVRVQEILQDGGLFTGDIVVIVIYFIGKRSLKTTRHHENNKNKDNEMGEMRRLTQSRLCII